jgi:hypothetical protein
MGLLNWLFGGNDRPDEDDMARARAYGQKAGQRFRASDPNMSGVATAHVQSHVADQYAASHSDEEAEEASAAFYYTYTGAPDTRAWCVECGGFYLPHEH